MVLHDGLLQLGYQFSTLRGSSPNANRAPERSPIDTDYRLHKIFVGSTEVNVRYVQRISFTPRPLAQQIAIVLKCRVGQVTQLVLDFAGEGSTNWVQKIKNHSRGFGTGIGTGIVLRAPLRGGAIFRWHVPEWNVTRGKQPV